MLDNKLNFAIIIQDNNMQVIDGIRFTSDDLDQINDKIGDLIDKYSDHYQYRRCILSSLRYHVEEYHKDGFTFGYGLPKGYIIISYIQQCILDKLSDLLKKK